jgi:rare lipoprotein A
MYLPACRCGSGDRPPVMALIAGALALALAACSSGGPAKRNAFDAKTGVSASPRMVWGERVPKGGGTYKLGAPYQISGRWYIPQEDPAYDRTGVASWYGDDFHGRKTANGEIYDMRALTAAHPTLPLPSYAHVTNLETGRTLLVRINDRGPYARDRIIDLSRASARALGFEGRGLTHVRVRYAGRAPLDGDDRREQAFLAGQPQNDVPGGRRFGEQMASWRRP